MLRTEDILNRMKLHFPRWMDIRRKIKTSTGGLYLTSIAETISEIQSAIDDYKKDFFIDSYMGKEEDVLTFLYKVDIGELEDISSLTLISPELIITKDEDLFYNNENYVYYNDGVLYLKKPEDKIIYKIDDFSYEGTYTKIHVWNIFDEFAAILGLRRFQWETNTELLNRILSFTNKKVNSSENGLKNAILSNLINIAPDLSEDDIVIERATPENLVKYYDEFETILDHMSKINKDVYKEKQWDIDVWNFNLKSIDYIPHAWDVLLNNYVNGIGFDDDLKVEILSQDQKTDATIYFYQKQIDLLNDYTKKHNIKEQFDLNLIQYSNDINSEKVKYRITASDAYPINVNKISFKNVEDRIGKFSENIQDIISNESELDIKDYSVLDTAYNYSIDFIPKSEIGNFQIDYCKQINGDNYINLLSDATPGFEKIGDGVRSATSKKYIEDMYQLDDSFNIKKTTDGFETVDLSKSSKMTINTNGLNGYNLYYDYEPVEIGLDYNKFEMQNCYIRNNSIVSDTVEEDKTIRFKGDINTLSFTIDGPFTMSYDYDGKSFQYNGSKSKTYDFSLNKTDKYETIDLTITFLTPECVLKNAKYSKYVLDFKLDKGTLDKNNNSYILPNYDQNNLQVEMLSFYGSSLILKYIYIGNRLKDYNGYFNISFNPDNGNKLYTKYENCTLRLTKYDKSTNKKLDVIEDYKPYKEYTAKQNTSVKLLLDDYNISDIVTSSGSITKNIVNKIKTEYLLNLSKGESIISVDLIGSCNKAIINQNLSSVLKNKGIEYYNYSFLITKNNDFLIAKNNTDNSIMYVYINKNDLFLDSSYSSLYVDAPDNITIKFIKAGQTTYSNYNEKDFDYLSFEPTNGNVYTAINEYNVLSLESKNIDVVNTFNNGYKESSLNHMFYKIESLNENYKVKFQTNNIFAKCDDTTLDKAKIIIKSVKPDLLEFNYNISNATLNLVLNSEIELPQYIEINNNDYIDIRQFMIQSSYRIKYSNKYNDNDNYLDYMFTEEVGVKTNKIIKLKYSNVNEIESISYHDIILTENKDFYVMYDEGIIIITNEDIMPNQDIIISYNINVPVSIEFDIDDLYEKIQYPINSLKLLGSETITNIANGDSIDLSIYDYYKDSDLISAKCSQDGFLYHMDNNLMTLTNEVEDNTIAIKTGYYYLNGQEYYLLADSKYDALNSIDGLIGHNVEKYNNSFIFKQKNENFISNSSFNQSIKGNIFDLDCNAKEVKSNSYLNELSTCENFNYWNTFAASLSITDAYNSAGIKFECDNSVNGYCYLPLSKTLEKGKNYKLSFYLSGNATAYLGKESNELKEFNFTSIIKINKQITQSNVIDNIYETSFNTDNDEKYYLILTGNGIVDDIILSDEDNYDIYNHIKNINLLNFDVAENVFSEYQTRLNLLDENGAIFEGTEMNSDGEIINSSNIDWGYTKFKTFNSYADFNNCVLDNVNIETSNNTCIVKTGSDAGTITSQPIYLGDVNIISNLVYKLNNITFDNMSGIKTKLLTSNNKNSGYKEISNSTNNMLTISHDKLSSYIKFIVEIPSNRVINNIEFFIEYLSDEKYQPIVMNNNKGIYTSKVLDSQYKERYYIKNVNIESYSNDINNYTIQIRGTKENNNNTVWTDWKTIELDDDMHIAANISFIDYRYFQVRVILKGEDAKIKIDSIDLEVI